MTLFNKGGGKGGGYLNDLKVLLSITLFNKGGKGGGKGGKEKVKLSSTI